MFVDNVQGRKTNLCIEVARVSWQAIQVQEDLN